jgi:hypothetical protein
LPRYILGQNNGKKYYCIMNASTPKQPFITPKGLRNMLLIILSFVLLAIVVWRWFDWKIEKIHQETITIKR